jgi:hypothetical protein
MVAAATFAVLSYSLLQLLQRKGQVQLPKVLGGAGPSEEIPEALSDWINQESEPWARQELRKRAQDAYQRLGSWAEAEAELRFVALDPHSPSSTASGF